jgi:tetratricopeptide (TPR) repeat protein
VLKHLFATTYQALPRDAKRLFVALAAFASPESGRSATLALATGIHLEHPEHALAILVQRRMLDIVVRTDLPPESDRQRVQLHPLLYAFAQEKYARWSQVQRTEEADTLAVHFAAYVTTMTPPGRAGDDAMGVDAHQITASLEWALGRSEAKEALATAAVALCAGMANTWYLRGDTTIGLRIFPLTIAVAQQVLNQRSTDRVNADGDEARFTLARLYASYGAVLQQVGRLRDAVTAYQESLELHTLAGTARGAADVHTALGEVKLLQGQVQEAESHYEQALTAYRAHDDWQGETAALAQLGIAAGLRSDRTAARHFARQSMRLVRAHAHEQDERATLLQVGMLAKEAGQVRVAAPLSLAVSTLHAQHMPVRSNAASCTPLAAWTRAAGASGAGGRPKLPYGRAVFSHRTYRALTVRRQRLIGSASPPLGNCIGNRRKMRFESASLR